MTFHNSGTWRKPQPYNERFDNDNFNRVCLHRGYRFGDHFGCECPNEKQVRRFEHVTEEFIPIDIERSVTEWLLRRTEEERKICGHNILPSEMIECLLMKEPRS